MNAVEIEAAVSELFAQPLERETFPYAFLQAFGNKQTTIDRLRASGKSSTNSSDLGGVLQKLNIHIAVAEPGGTPRLLEALRASPATAKAKAQFVLATDGDMVQAENLASGETLACTWAEMPEHFGFFLALAGISTVRQIRDNPIDIRATARLNKLYASLLQDNPEWGQARRRHDMNHFMARLIFCYFAEDTGIFSQRGLFTKTMQEMSAADASNTHTVMAEIFRAMNTPAHKRQAAGLRPWADKFPYVNGGLFANNNANNNADGSADTSAPVIPRFGKAARSHLLDAGGLDWTQINPDIFGSMIQAVADEGERGQLGMHYTSVPNILKVLNPLFLDELRQRLEQAAGSPQKLLNLRRRIARIRVLDPACGSGNFLVIAYKQLREIEAAINEQRGEKGRKSDIPLTNFRGIELRDFPAEIARLALIIAEYQCNERYLGQKQALAEFLPLAKDNWITCGNALRLDWPQLMGAAGAAGQGGSAVKLTADDLFETPLEQAEIDFENQGSETYICGNPPYLGYSQQSPEQKADLQAIFEHRSKNWKSLDYVAGWFMKAADFARHASGTRCASAFVATNSICQGQQVPILWPLLFESGQHIHFAHTSFKWANLASHNAGVTVAIVGITNQNVPVKRLYTPEENAPGKTAMREVSNINAYLIAEENIIIEKCNSSISQLPEMLLGNTPRDGGHLLLKASEIDTLDLTPQQRQRFIRKILGSAEMIRGIERYCIWITDADAQQAEKIPAIARRLQAVREMRKASPRASTAELAELPYRFSEVRQTGNETLIVVPSVSSESRDYLPVGYEPAGSIVSNLAFALYDAPLWNLALIASRLHLVWIAAVCGKLETRFRYSNTLGWNTFPVPLLTDYNRQMLTECAEGILLARESHFPATIADLYQPGAMPANLRAAHEQNDEVIERIYIGRLFKNDTERLEKLFAMYAQMTAKKE